MKKKIKNSTKVLLIFLAIIACAIVYFGVIEYYKKAQKTQEQVQEEISHEKLYDLAAFPKIDASLATQPLTNAIVKDFTGGDDFDTSILNYSNTHPGYVKLINDEVDLIVVTEPSKEELELAKQKGI